MNNPIQLLIFDWDGTLMDSEARIVACMRAAVADLGLAPLPHARMSNVIGLGLPEAIEMLFPGSDETFAREFVARYRHHFLGHEQTPSKLFPGAYDTLQTLHELGYGLAIATGKGRRGLDQALKETGCDRFFHVTRCADEAASKPHPEMLIDIFGTLGIDPKAGLMIGDTEYDMQMANNALTHALAVSYGVHSADRLLKHSPLGCLDDICDLPGWLTANRPLAANRESGC